MENILGIVTGVIGIIGAIVGGMTWYKGSVEQRYAAQRDFGHLRRNQEQLITNVDRLFSDLENHLDRQDGEIQNLKLKLIELNSFNHRPTGNN